MPTLPFDEVLSRLDANGATESGGSSFAKYLVRTDSSGHIDSSLFSSTLSTYTVSDESELPVDAKNGEIAILEDTATYRYNEAANSGAGGWEIIAYLGTTNVPFNPSGTALTSTNAQDAIAELSDRAVLVDTERTVTSTVTFGVTDQAAFAISSTSRNYPITNLNSELHNGYTLAQVLNVANHTGYIPAIRLNPAVTYPINIGGTSALSINSVHANSAADLDPGVVVDDATHAVTADSATTATTATSATNILDGSTPRNIAYLLNISNILSGTLPAGRFNATSHGSLAGGTLHALAIPDSSITVDGTGQVTATSGGTAGFISSADAYKLSTLNYGVTNVKIYRALITQSSTSAPVATVLEHSLTGTVTWARTGTGTYTVAFSSAPTASKTMVFMSPTTASSGVKTFSVNTTNPALYTVSSYSAGTLTDGVLQVTPIEIIVYP